MKPETSAPVAPAALPPPDADPAIVAEVGRAAARGSRKLFVFLGIAALLFGLMHLTPLGERIRDWPAIYALMESGGWEAALWFVGLTAALMAVGTPRLLFYVLGGFAFGFWAGLALSLVGSLIGSFIAFRAARWGGRDWLKRRFGQRRFFARIVQTRPTALSVALVRCLPVSNAVINIALAMSRVRSRAFLLGTLIGFLPQGVVAVLIGSGVADDVPLEGAIQLVAAALIALMISGYSIWRKRRDQGQG